jgi:16S rRNA (uracil1498-N3)-methyltransferase
VNPALRHSAAHVFVHSLAAPELTDDDAHHLFRVLRLREGEQVSVSDGRGGWRLTTVVGKALAVAGDIAQLPAPPAVTIAVAIPKGDRLEWMVQKLTEIGVAEITFLHCERSAVRWAPDRAVRQLERVARVAREASSQSRRVWLPTLTGPVPFSEVAARPDAVVADPDGVPYERRTGPCTVIIGPEGGLTALELAAASRTQRWGDHVLRVETAAIVAAASLLTH